MKLFKVMSPTGRDPHYTNSKKIAKSLREARTDSAIICRGPDHWRGESFNVSRNTPKTRRSRR